MITILLAGIFALAPPTDVRAYDTPNDGGGSITTEWQLSPDDAAIEGYEIYRSEADEIYELVGFLGSGRTKYEDETEDRIEYTYKVAALQDAERSYSEPSSPVRSKPQWFNMGATVLFIAMIVFSVIILFFINQARRGKRLFIRKISGLDAVDEAVGRATEMGRPILYCMGIGRISNIATIASFNILGEIAKKTGQYETPLIVPISDPVVYTVAREIVKESYTTIGRPDLFDTDKVYFVTDSQFAYAAAVDGVMLREKPAANFLIGYFKAESLILAETGASTGAIQIAGTDQVTQLPFFVTACDFTLIGEELYAASAYISKEPLLLGAIKGEDWGKVVIFTALVIGSIIGLLTKFPILSLFR
ncbi:fibronectin type III domain-containing protein [candidate division WOR-3 bacterium]|nr:fibronectin type III domain-containing protein [candidate division WOR-3 bacterium]